MKRAIFFPILNFIVVTVILAQVSPTPVINNEIRDNGSLRMREVSLERVKREAKNRSRRDSNEEAANKFGQIKEDFEEIQKLQTVIVKAYTTGREIDYRKISESAAEITKRSIRLEAHLFNLKPYHKTGEKETIGSGVKELIVELDKVIGNFIGNPSFKNRKLVNQKDAENARSDLEKVIELSEALSGEAMKRIRQNEPVIFPQL